MGMTDSIRGMFNSGPAPAQTRNGVVTVEPSRQMNQQNFGQRPVPQQSPPVESYGKQPYEDPMVSKLRQYALIGLTGIVGLGVIVFIVVRVIQNILG